jgi:hypothetical protein
MPPTTATEMKTTTLTLELPAELAARLAEAVDPAEMTRFAVAALEDALDREPDEELVEALREGTADAEAGRLLTLEEEVDAHLEAAIAQRRADREAQRLSPRQAA